MLPKEISNVQMSVIVPNRSRDGFLFSVTKLPQSLFSYFGFESC